MENNKTLAIVGCDAASEIVCSLRELCFDVVVLPRHDALPIPVRSHADMLMFELHKHVFAEKKYIKLAKPAFDKISDAGYDIIPCNISLGDAYPNDIAFNVANCNGTIYGNIKYNAPQIIEFAMRLGIKAQAIKQGYAKCSTVTLKNAIITADKGIAKSAKANGLSVLKINNSPNSVKLDGYNYGFLGGACGVIDNKVYFSGNIDLHPDGDTIKSFCQSQGFETICLTESKLVDIGGIIFLPRYS